MQRLTIMGCYWGTNLMPSSVKRLKLLIHKWTNTLNHKNWKVTKNWTALCCLHPATHTVIAISVFFC